MRDTPHAVSSSEWDGEIKPEGGVGGGGVLPDSNLK